MRAITDVKFNERVYNNCVCDICGKHRVDVIIMQFGIDSGDFHYCNDTVEICEECATKIVSIFKNKEVK